MLLNLLKTVINGNIQIQSSYRIGPIFSMAKSAGYFEEKTEEAKALFKTSLNTDGSLKSKKELQKIDYNRYENV